MYIRICKHIYVYIYIYIYMIRYLCLFHCALIGEEGVIDMGTVEAAIGTGEEGADIVGVARILGIVMIGVSL